MSGPRRRAARPRDFSQRRLFPGSAGVLPPDWGRRAAERIQAIPPALFFALLLGVCWLGAAARPDHTGATFVFVLGDWLLLTLLPRARRSFGEPQPQALALAIVRAPFGLLPLPWVVAAQLTGTALAIYALWFEPQRFGVTRERLRSARLGAEPPLRLLHFGDLHMERITPREHALVEAARELRPDLIVFSGDFLSTSYADDAPAHHACRWVFSQLSAPLGVFVVSGSPAIDRPELMPSLLEGAPVRWLRNESVTLRAGTRAIELVGVSCTHRPFLDGPILRRICQPPGSGSAPFRILLYHTPDLAPEAAEAGIDLQLSGHTHGGQVRVPGWGALITGSLYGKSFEMGRYEVSGMTLYVTRGVGLEGALAPRVRCLCPPEAVLWELGG
jgi:uncharacterized protein